ncbi:MAG TPA: hypothetical protein VNM48_18600, partial [Chloroflexota bacterium]|nr:hypothetical protein [Chloroflexota bacterium]
MKPIAWRLGSLHRLGKSPLPHLRRLRPRRPNRPRSISLRVRLAFVSSSLLGLTLVTFSLAVYFTQARALTDEVDRSLIDRAEV